MIAKVLLSIALVITLTACTDQVTSSPVSSPFESTDITGIGWGHDFHLTDHNGVSRRVADFNGKVMMVSFGYVNCPDMCPTTLFKMAQVRAQLGNNAHRLQGLFITIDPGRDTPSVLAQYVPAFDSTFLGLYGDEQTTVALAKEFKIFYAAQKTDAQGHYTVDHSGAIYVFDTKGRLRLMMRPNLAIKTLVADVSQLLAE